MLHIFGRAFLQKIFWRMENSKLVPQIEGQIAILPKGFIKKRCFAIFFISSLMLLGLSFSMHPKRLSILKTLLWNGGEILL